MSKYMEGGSFDTLYQYICQGPSGSQIAYLTQGFSGGFNKGPTGVYKGVGRVKG